MDKKNKKESYASQYMAMGMCMGVAFGGIFGLTIFDNMPIGTSSVYV
ncbi:MAG: hypothetical protein K2J47_04250 [Ruminococcus sp.]|nr:hypothetical protein [Ruminococcus sp.]